MTRVSPPELARELPGPQASRGGTRAPRRTSSSAENPPKAPAPTTATWGERRRAPRGFPRRRADSALPAIAPRSARRERRTAGLLPMGLEPEVYTSDDALRTDGANYPKGAAWGVPGFLWGGSGGVRRRVSVF